MDSGDLSKADAVTLHLPPNVMDRLVPKPEKLKPAARIISHFFKFREVPPDQSLRIESKDDGDIHDVHR